MYNTENLCNVDTIMIQFTINDKAFLNFLLVKKGGEINLLLNCQEIENTLKKRLNSKKGIVELESKYLILIDGCLLICITFRPKNISIIMYKWPIFHGR